MQDAPRFGIERFKSWWRAPVRPRDRVLGAVVGAVAGFWLGLLSYLSLVQSVADPVLFVPVVVATFSVAGAVFPKVATLVLFPFSTLGGGGV